MMSMAVAGRPMYPEEARLSSVVLLRDAFMVDAVLEIYPEELR